MTNNENTATKTLTTEEERREYWEDWLATQCHRCNCMPGMCLVCDLYDEYKRNVYRNDKSYRRI